MTQQLAMQFAAIRNLAIASAKAGRSASFTFNGKRYRVEPDRDTLGAWWTVLD